MKCILIYTIFLLNNLIGHCNNIYGNVTSCLFSIYLYKLDLLHHSSNLADTQGSHLYNHTTNSLHHTLCIILM